MKGVPISAMSPKRTAVKKLIEKGWADEAISKQVYYSLEVVAKLRKELFRTRGVNG